MNINGGWIRCTLVARWDVGQSTYDDLEHHTWTFTGGVAGSIDATPKPINASWSAKGDGSLKQTNPIIWKIFGGRPVVLSVLQPAQTSLIHLTRATAPTNDPFGIKSSQGGVTTRAPLNELTLPPELQWSSTSNALVFSNPGLMKASNDSIYLAGANKGTKTANWQWSINLTP